MAVDPKKSKKTKKEIEAEIVKEFNVIKELCDNGVNAISKNGRSSSSDIRQTEDVTYDIQDKLDDIRDLLFDLEEAVE
jgi:gas vesicle protein